MRSRIGVHRCRQAGAAAEAERGQATWRPRKLRWFSIRRHLAPVGGCCSCISHLATTQLCGCPSLHTASWRVTIVTRCVHASTISDPTSPMFDLHWSIGPHPQDRRQALHQRTLAHQRSCGTPCGIREWVPAPVTDSEGGTVMPRAQDPYVNASRYLAAAITSFTPERHLLGK